MHRSPRSPRSPSSPRSAPRLLILTLVLTLGACGPGDPDTGSTGASSDAATAGATDAVTTGASQASTSAATESASTTVASEATTAASADTSGSGGPHECGEQSCGPAQVCILPCCGGPAPGCSDVDARGACPDGGMPVPADQCQFGGCTGQLCCPPVNCVADPPFCAAVTDLRCTDNNCSIGGCFGTLGPDATQLECQCA